MNEHTPSGIVTCCTYGEITPDKLYDSFLKPSKRIKIYNFDKAAHPFNQTRSTTAATKFEEKSLHPFVFRPLNDILTRSVATWGGTSIKQFNS